MNTMISEIRKDNPVGSYSQAEAAAIYPDSPVSSAPENGQLFIRSVASRRDTQTTTGSANPEDGSTQPLVVSSSSSSSAAAAAAAAAVAAAASSCTMTSGEFMQSTPLFVPRSKKNLFYKTLCFLLLVLQGGVLDFYLIVFTDLYWCSWIATDLVVISGWGIFFIKNARSKRERACGFHQKISIFGCNLGEFTFAYLAWLIYVIACTPKVVLILETSILDLITLKVPFGITGFKVTALLAVPLLFCLINSVVEDNNGATRYHSQSCFMSTCMDVLDGFTLVEMLLKNEIPNPYLKYTVITVYFLALSVPVVWLYELTAASRMHCRWVWARFLTGAVVNAPLLVVRCFLVFLYKRPVSVFMFKNVFFLACRCLELLEQCASVQRFARATNGARFSRGVSENDMSCPHGYVNTLAVNTQA